MLVVGNVNGEITKLFQLVDNIQSKKGKFDLLFCVGKFFPPTVEDMKQFKREVLQSEKSRMPIDTFFVDSSEMIAPFMNSAKGRDGVSFAKNLSFIGRSGIKVIKGLRVAFISGVDSDLLGSEVMGADPEKEYLANHFVSADINKVIGEYQELVKESGQVGVDLLLTG